MNRAGIAERVARGLGRAAAVLGEECTIYRPKAPGPAIAPRWRLGTVWAAMAEGNGDFTRAAGYGEATETGIFNTTDREAGDYLVAANGTAWFVADVPSFAGARVVRCNEVVSVKRAPAADAGVGAYQASTLANEDTILTGFPASVLREGSSGGMQAELPGDMRLGTWRVLLPAAAVIRTGDVIVLADTSRAVVSLAERSALGWRLSASVAAT